MEFDEEHEDQEEEIANIPQIPTTENNYQELGEGGPISQAAATLRKNNVPIPRYRECLKNHAVGIGGQAVDGCGEFLPSGEEGTLDALKCAACNCHRNFHRKEVEGEILNFHHPTPPPPILHHPPHHYPYRYHQRPLALPSISSREDIEEYVSNPSSSGGSGSRKRFRTKFTQDQKEKMFAFAEGLGWRIQKENEAAVQQFCAETNIRRQVFKVWMHNNKNTLGEGVVVALRG
ncbi:zinc-finger homeodomain protein 2-like isoform X1 [Nicotiana tomentosiformis]|uniref:zinc-finger homeodomain protein 2-like isoform X1 n=1 Tax=Nicotiana tomentosiformis TaxID=4098 RepID=UPI00388C4F53